MIGRTHEAGAMAALMTAAVYFAPTKLSAATVAVALIANVVGAMLPDIDQASNRLWDMVPGGDFSGKIFKNFLGSHRTLSHSLLGLFLVFELNQWLLPKVFNDQYINTGIVFNSLMIGYISHLVLDGLTEEGLPLFFPFKWKIGFPPWKHLRIKTGHWVEKILIFPAILVFLGWYGFSNWIILRGILF